MLQDSQTREGPRAGGLLFYEKTRRPDRVGRPWANSLEPLFVVAEIAAGAAFGRGGCTAAASGGFLLLFAGFLDESFARQANLVALDGEDLYQDLVAELQLVADVADAMFGDLADVQEAIG